ncbi:hypothetical protein DL93DRAFT_2084400 [Clavulina sp. PMI_390]|nr:hypothetical protein DL93DRAFT_2084400 [Clavulina sp. PMI_390]
MSSSTTARAGDDSLHATPQPPKPRVFSHSIWSSEVAKLRGVYLKAIIPTIIITIIVMWLCLPVYWGSLAHQRSYTHGLKVYLVDHDGSDIGAAITAAVQANIANNTKYKLGWEIANPGMYPTNEDAIEGVLDEQSWMTVVVQPNATTNLIAARAMGNASYDPTQAILAYYSQARNEQAAGTYIVPYSEQLLTLATAQLNAKFLANFTTANSANATAWLTAAQAPQTLSGPVSFTIVNLRPFTAPVATAILLVGSIYVIIFGFVITMASFAVRAPIEPFLKTPQLLLMRIAAPLLIYIPLSFAFAMLSLPYKVPFGAHPGFGYAGGFFVYWVFLYLTMGSLGLATEFAIQILGPRFMTFFLLPLIISNVSVASVPIDLEPWFYKYGYGFPVYNMSIATRTILFNTKNHMARNAGVLLGWIALNILTITCITLWQRRKHRRSVAREAAVGGLEGGDAQAGKGKADAEEERIEREEREVEREEEPLEREQKMTGYMRGEKTPEMLADA